MKKYNLTITERQAERIIQALDLYTRLSCGQVRELNNIIFEKNSKAPDWVLAVLQRRMFPSLTGLNHSHGIHSPKIPDKIRESYDIFKVLMFEFNKDKGIMNVYADKVKQTSIQGLPKFEESENGI